MKARRLKLKMPSPALMAALLTVVLLTFALLFLPALGMADNGDFFRVTYGQGIYNFKRNAPEQYFDYFTREFGLFQYYNESGGSIFTSQVPFIELAKVLNGLLNPKTGVFDIRFLGAIQIIYLAAALYFAVEYATCNMKRGVGAYLVALLAVIIFADFNYATYFNSFFAEGIVLISLLFTVACALLLTKRRYPPYLMLSLIVFNSLVLICAKQQNAPLGALIGILLVILPFVKPSPCRLELEELQIRPACLRAQKRRAMLEKRMQREEERDGTIRSWRFRTASIAAGCFLALCGAMVYVLIPKGFVDINQYHAMTRGMLMTSDNPERTLAEFDIDRQFALLSKEIYFERYPVISVESEALHEEFLKKYSFLSVTSYYLTHPGQLFVILDIAAKNSYEINPISIGNFEESAGREPGAKVEAFTLYSTINRSLVPRTIGFMIIWIALGIGLSFRDRGRTWIILFCILMGLSQVGVSIIGAGDADLSKHVFIYNVTFDIVNFIGFASLIAIVSQRLGLFWQKRKEGDVRVEVKPEEAVFEKSALSEGN